MNIFKTALFLISVLFFACSNEKEIDVYNDLNEQENKIDLSATKETDKAKTMIVCISKTSVYFNGGLVQENKFEEKIKLFFERFMDSSEIFNVLVFYEDVQPIDYEEYISSIKKIYQEFLDRKAQEKYNKTFEQLFAHEKYALPYRISFNEIERKFMTESQSTSGLKCQ